MNKATFIAVIFNIYKNYIYNMSNIYLKIYF